MKHLVALALASAWNRRFTLTLTVPAIAFSVAMLLGVERMRTAAHESFAHSISGTDLVVGPRTSPVQLMLYAVLRIGEATTNMKWASYEELARNPDVAWIVSAASRGREALVPGGAPKSTSTRPRLALTPVGRQTTVFCTIERASYSGAHRADRRRLEAFRSRGACGDRWRPDEE